MELPRTQRILAAAGLWGAILTVAILALSAFMRLATGFDAGEAVSRLPESVETAARIAHRVAAMGVGILAAVALVVAATQRPAPRGLLAAAGAIVFLTLVLAMIGRHTPGYKVDAVILTNVVAGTALACAFWWLREHARFGARAPDASGAGIAWGALATLLAVSSLGALASAAAMRGAPALGPAHLGVAALFLALALAAAWRHRARRFAAGAVAALALLQFALGWVVQAAGSARPVALTFSHAIIACMLGLVLVSLAARPQRRE